MQNKEAQKPLLSKKTNMPETATQYAHQNIHLIDYAHENQHQPSDVATNTPKQTKHAFQLLCVNLCTCACMTSYVSCIVHGTWSTQSFFCLNGSLNICSTLWYSQTFLPHSSIFIPAVLLTNVLTSIVYILVTKKTQSSPTPEAQHILINNLIVAALEDHLKIDTQDTSTLIQDINAWIDSLLLKRTNNTLSTSEENFLEMIEYSDQVLHHSMAGIIKEHIANKTPTETNNFLFLPLAYFENNTLHHNKSVKINPAMKDRVMTGAALQEVLNKPMNMPHFFLDSEHAHLPITLHTEDIYIPHESIAMLSEIFKRNNHKAATTMTK